MGKSGMAGALENPSVYIIKFPPNILLSPWISGETCRRPLVDQLMSHRVQLGYFEPVITFLVRNEDRL